MIVHIVGARPNFMKASPLVAELDRRGFSQRIVHTGQHYDEKMSGVFFDELGLRRPDVNLNVGSGSHAQQTAAIMQLVEPELLREKPDWLVVYGDVNSTVAAALVASKLGIRVAHVEAGCRSFDRSMPEEINRIVTDALSDVLFAPTGPAAENLRKEGYPEEKIRVPGNLMIDTLTRLLPRVEAAGSRMCEALGISEKKFVLVTLHRPSNVDDPERLGAILTSLAAVAETRPVVFPVHPRTRKMLDSGAAGRVHPGIRLLEPMGYLEFTGLQKRAAAVLTDSGGVQEEASFLDVPCITLRRNTEHVITLEHGTNVLLGDDFHRIPELVNHHPRPVSNRSAFSTWDGRTAGRMADYFELHGS